MMVQWKKDIGVEATGVINAALAVIGCVIRIRPVDLAETHITSIKE